MSVRNQVARARAARGISAAALAQQAGVSRQTIYAIEAGSYVPNTAVALRLARILDVSVEELFSLQGESAARSSVRDVDVLNVGARLHAGQPLQLARVGRRISAVYSPPMSVGLPPFDGLLRRRKGSAKASVELMGDEADLEKRILVAGCDPGISVLARHLMQSAGFEVVTAGCSSLQALQWLKERRIHIAGSHLCDEGAGVTNLRAIRRVLPGGGYRVVAFAGWEEGLVTAGNAKRIRSIADLARKGVRIVNREKGAGSRFLLDRSLKALGVRPSRVEGYKDIAHGHIPAAWHVYAGKADCCIATRAAARVFGLRFVPLVSEQFDLVIPRRYLAMPAVEALLDTLNRAALRRQLAELGGYDTSQTGKVLT